MSNQHLRASRIGPKMRLATDIAYEEPGIGWDELADRGERRRVAAVVGDDVSAELPPETIITGTDQTVADLGLGDADSRAILWDNAAKLLGLSVTA